MKQKKKVHRYEDASENVLLQAFRYERNLRECRLAAGTSALCYVHLNLTSAIVNETGMYLTNLKVVIMSPSPSKLLWTKGKPSVPAYTC